MSFHLVTRQSIVEPGSLVGYPWERHWPNTSIVGFFGGPMSASFCTIQSFIEDTMTIMLLFYVCIMNILRCLHIFVWKCGAFYNEDFMAKLSSICVPFTMSMFCFNGHFLGLHQNKVNYQVCLGRTVEESDLMFRFQTNLNDTTCFNETPGLIGNNDLIHNPHNWATITCISVIVITTACLLIKSKSKPEPQSEPQIQRFNRPVNAHIVESTVFMSLFVFLIIICVIPIGVGSWMMENHPSMINKQPGKFLIHLSLIISPTTWSVFVPIILYWRNKKMTAYYMKRINEMFGRSENHVEAIEMAPGRHGTAVKNQIQVAPEETPEPPITRGYDVDKSQTENPLPCEVPESY